MKGIFVVWNVLYPTKNKVRNCFAVILVVLWLSVTFFRGSFLFCISVRIYNRYVCNNTLFEQYLWCRKTTSNKTQQCVFCSHINHIDRSFCEIVTFCLLLLSYKEKIEQDSDSINKKVMAKNQRHLLLLFEDVYNRESVDFHTSIAVCMVQMEGRIWQ